MAVVWRHFLSGLKWCMLVNVHITASTEWEKGAEGVGGREGPEMGPPSVAAEILLPII